MIGREKDGVWHGGSDSVRPEKAGATTDGYEVIPFLTPYERLTCVMWGSLVLTRDGERSVQSLEPHDLLITLGGSQMWRSVSRIHERRVDNLAPTLAPVLIKAGALMPGSPIRDTRVAPGQGVWLEGAVVPARLLLNGDTILQEPVNGRVTYVTVVLHDPGLLVVDGTVLDGGPGGPAGRSGAPVILGGPGLDAIRMRIEGRLGNDA